MRRRLWIDVWTRLLAVAVSATAVSPAAGQFWDHLDDPPATQSTTAEAPKPADDVTDADRVARLQRAIDDTHRQLAELKRRLSDPRSEFAQAEAEFKALDKQLEAQRQELAEAQQRGDEASSANLERAIADLTTRRNLTRARFDLALKERKTVNEQITALELKVQGDLAALSKLKGDAPAASQPAAGPPATITPAGDAAKEAPSGNVSGGQPAGDAPKSVAPATEPPVLPGIPAFAPPADKPPSAELVKAQETAAEKKGEAQAAQQEVKTVIDRIAALRKSIDGEQKLHETARQRVENAKETERALYEEQQNRWGEGATREELSQIATKIGEARRRLRDAEREREAHSQRIDRLQFELAELQNEQIDAARVAEAKRVEAERAQKTVEQLQNPWTVTNAVNWLIARGPRVVAIILGTVLLLWLVRVAQGRIVKLLAGRADHGSYADRQKRAQTLVSVFRSAAVVAIYAWAALLLLAEFNINIIPLLGGAAVLGLAVAFGAQNLIRDYFYGFMILLENQYTVNDVVKVGDVSGQVERITLRITVLRDLDGTVHFVPNGEINRVSNMTHGWSRALFDVPVAYTENVDQVMEVLLELGKELRRDPNYRSLILEMPEMLGVDRFDESAIIIKFFIKTRPLQQWAVKRELLRRIKLKFDELGIEIPLPQRMVFHRQADSDGTGLNNVSAPDDTLLPSARAAAPAASAARKPAPSTL